VIVILEQRKFLPVLVLNIQWLYRATPSIWKNCNWQIWSMTSQPKSRLIPPPSCRLTQTWRRRIEKISFDHNENKCVMFVAYISCMNSNSFWWYQLMLYFLLSVYVREIKKNVIQLENCVFQLHFQVQKFGIRSESLTLMRVTQM
jgi:hypothetical protein